MSVRWLGGKGIPGRRNPLCKSPLFAKSWMKLGDRELLSVAEETEPEE